MRETLVGKHLLTRASVVMDIMGWSSSSMAKRYQHITAQIRKDIANRVGGLLWDAVEDGPGDDEDGPAGVSAPA